MPKFLTWFKFIFLVVALVAVLWARKSVNHGHLNGALAAIGLSDSGTQGPAALNWCTTRIQTVEFPDGTRLTQEGRNWVAYSPRRHVLNFVAAEKLIARFCDVQGTQVHVGGAFAAAAEVHMIDGSVKNFLQGSGLYMLDGHVYRSAQLGEALAGIRRLLDKGTGVL